MASPSETTSDVTGRLVSLDAYRGIVMFVLAASGFGFAKTAANAPHSEFLQYLEFHTTHPEWSSQFYLVGFSLWDMIQPAFMFMVGVSMPYSYTKRAERGDSFLQRSMHAWARALILVLLGVFLQSNWKSETNWIFTNVLSQMGLGYGFLFLLVGRSFRFQAICGGVVLLLYWILMCVFPLGDAGIAARFVDGTSMPQQVDFLFLDLFPRSEPFDGSPYATLNFVPSFVTMLLGVICGQLLMDGDTSASVKLKRLLMGGIACLGAGVAMSLVGCPIVKKLWTPSWTLFSGAYVVWMLAALYWIIDVKGWRGWSFPFIVVGLNPITMYFMGQTMKPWVRKTLNTHLPEFLFTGSYSPIVEACLVVGVFWLILFWMYRQRTFVRI